MADEMHQLPGCGFAFGCAVAPGWHPRQLHAILDDVEEFAIRQFLRGWLAHVWRPWIERTPHVRVAATVVAVAAGTVIGPVRHCRAQHLFSGLNGVGAAALPGRDRE